MESFPVIDVHFYRRNCPSYPTQGCFSHSMQMASYERGKSDFFVTLYDSSLYLFSSVQSCIGLKTAPISGELLDRVDGLSAMAGDGSQRPFWCFGKPDV